MSGSDGHGVQMGQEIETILTNFNDDEFKDINGPVLEYQRKTQQLMKSRERSIKDAIIALTQDCEAAGDAIQETEGREVAKQDVQQAVADVKHAENNKGGIGTQVAALKAEHNVCEQERKRLKVEREKVEQGTTKALPSCRHDASLYHLITGIRWQYDCPPEEVKGYVSNKDKVRTFALNSNQNSKFFIANYLWDLIEPDW